MKPVVVIPTYWEASQDGVCTPGGYDHATDIYSTTPDLDRCLRSLEQVRKLPRVVILVVCPAAATARVRRRVEEIAAAHPSIDALVVTNAEASHIADRVAELAPNVIGEPTRLRCHSKHGSGRRGDFWARHRRFLG